MQVSRRNILTLIPMGLAGLVLKGSNVSQALSALEIAAQPKRYLIGTINDSFHDLGIVEMYSDGMLLTQSVEFADQYAAENRYFIRNDLAKEFTLWDFDCMLYKKGELVNRMTVNGSIENGKLVIIYRRGPIPQNPLEARLTLAAYIQSSMHELEVRDEQGIKSYLAYFNDMLRKYRPDTLKPMPPNYDPINVMEGVGSVQIPN